nr:hypothetical protein [Patescibacteria group bacterium]
VQRSGLDIVLEDEIHMSVRLTDRDPPTAVRIHLSFLPEENGVHKISAGGHAYIILGMYWFDQCLKSRDWDTLQRVFFPMWIALEVEFRNRRLQLLWKRLRDDDIRTWCSMMESYFAGLDGDASLADPPIARLSNKEHPLLATTFSRVMGWLEHRLNFLEHISASRKELNEICQIWQGRADSPAIKYFLSPYYWNTPTRVFLEPNSLETLRARSGRICDRMARLVENFRPDLAKAIREAVEAEASSSAQ